MDDYEKDVYGSGISQKEVLEILKESKAFLGELESRCSRIENTYMDMKENPIVQLVRKNGEAAEKEYFRIIEAQGHMLGDLRSELHMLNNRYMMQHRIILALRLLPGQYYQCIQRVYIDGEKWEAVQNELGIGSAQLYRRLSKGTQLIAAIYNTDRSNEELVRSYLDIRKLEKTKPNKKKTPDPCEDGHQVTIMELFQKETTQAVQKQGE